MAAVVHEVWVSHDEFGNELPTCILAGRLGNDARKLLVEEDAHYQYSFLADSHFDAMTKYHQRQWNEVYKNPDPHPWHIQPYPKEWADQQLKDGIKPSDYD